MDDVDLLALQLVHHGLHAAAAHTDAGAHGVDGAILRHHRDLGAAARIAGHGFDLDDGVVNFWHLLREQLRHELRPCSRQENLRSAILAADVIDISPHAVAKLVVLARQRLVAANDRLRPAEVDHDVAVLGALDNAADDLADAVLVFLELALALGLAHFLHDDLLGVLRGHPAEIERRQGLGDKVANLRLGVTLFRVLDGDFGGVERHLLHDLQEARQLDLARARVDLGADLVLAAVARLRRLLDRVLHRGQHKRPVNGLLARDRVSDLQQFQAVRANPGLSHRSTPNLLSSLVLLVRRPRPISGLELLPVSAKPGSTHR